MWTRCTVAADRAALALAVGSQQVLDYTFDLGYCYPRDKPEC